MEEDETKIPKKLAYEDSKVEERNKLASELKKEIVDIGKKCFDSELIADFENTSLKDLEQHLGIDS